LELTAGPPTLEKRVWTLESNLAKLEGRVKADREKAASDLERVKKAQSDRLAELERERREREEADREILRASVALQWWGIGLFVSGTIVSVVANVMGA
jgi:hypothetical protein